MPKSPTTAWRVNLKFVMAWILVPLPSPSRHSYGSLMSVTADLKTGHRVTVSDQGDSLQVSCTCGGSSATWCSDIVAVICGDRAALVSPSQIGSLNAAGKIIERYVYLLPVLTARLDDAKTDPARVDEVLALEAAITRLLNRQPPDDPNQAAHDASWTH